LAAAIRDRFDLESELIPSGGGVFEVRADGELIFSKKRTGRFPEHDEVFSVLAGKLEG
jgi:selenoprotein W-related protein